MQLEENEIAVPIKGFEKYYITNMGRVWSTLSNKWLVPMLNQRGNHKRFAVSLGSKNKKYVHRLVAEAFIPNPLNLPEVDHIDGDGTNNKVENLRWCTHDINMQNSITKERIKKNGGAFVEIEEISTGKLFYGYEDVAKNFGVCKETVRKHVQNIVLKPRCV